MAPRTTLPTSEICRITGLTASTLRHYQDLGLIRSHLRDGRRRWPVAATRQRVALIRIGLSAGLSLTDIAAGLADLPHGAVEGDVDWQQLLWAWRRRAQEQQAVLATVITDLDRCLSCRCGNGSEDDDGDEEDPADTVGSATTHCPLVDLYNPLTAPATAMC